MFTLYFDSRLFNHVKISRYLMIFLSLKAADLFQYASGVKGLWYLTNIVPTLKAGKISEKTQKFIIKQFVKASPESFP